MSEKQGARETVERMAERLYKGSKGQMTEAQAKARAVRSANRIHHGDKSPPKRR